MVRAICILYLYYLIGWIAGIMKLEWWSALILGLFVGASFNKMAMVIARSIAEEMKNKAMGKK